MGLEICNFKVALYIFIYILIFIYFLYFFIFIFFFLHLRHINTKWRSEKTVYQEVGSKALEGRSKVLLQKEFDLVSSFSFTFLYHNLIKMRWCLKCIFLMPSWTRRCMLFKQCRSNLVPFHSVPPFPPSKTLKGNIFLSLARETWVLSLPYLVTTVLKTPK